MSDAERAIRRALATSCGNCGVPTDYAVERIAMLIERGEATIELARQCGGDYLIRRIEELKGQVSA